jgi:hypothetical protein
MWQGFIRTQQDGHISELLLAMRIVTIFARPSSRKTPEERAVPIKKAKIRQLVLSVLCLRN